MGFRLLFPVSLALLVFELDEMSFDPPPTQAKVAQTPTRVRVNPRTAGGWFPPFSSFFSSREQSLALPLGHQ